MPGLQAPTPLAGDPQLIAIEWTTRRHSGFARSWRNEPFFPTLSHAVPGGPLWINEIRTMAIVSSAG